MTTNEQNPIIPPRMAAELARFASVSPALGENAADLAKGYAELHNLLAQLVIFARCFPLAFVRGGVAAQAVELSLPETAGAIRQLVGAMAAVAPNHQALCESLKPFEIPGIPLEETPENVVTFEAPEVTH